jgi:ferredoxin
MSEHSLAAVTLHGGPATEIWPDLAQVLTRASGQPILRCYQCHKCSSGCPAAEFMDFAPSQLVRLATYGLAQDLLTCKAIWTCTGCLTCGLRCPNGIDIGAINDVLKSWILSGSLPRGVSLKIGTDKPKAGDGRAVLFHKLFVGSLRHLGRMHELALMGGYKVFSGDIFSDLPSGFKMLAQGKLPLLPKLRPYRREVAAMFQRAAIVSRRRLRPVRRLNDLGREGRGR